MLSIAIEPLRRLGELTHNVGKGQELFIELVAAGFAEPHKRIQLIRKVSLPLDDQSNSVCWTLWGVWRARGQEENLTLLDMNVARLTIIDDLHCDIALDLVEELLALVIVIILAIIRSTHHHNDELRVLVDLGIPNWGLRR
jgi:hypothetical protein